jgi:hypothetical protein
VGMGSLEDVPLRRERIGERERVTRSCSPSVAGKREVERASEQVGVGCAGGGWGLIKTG